MATSAHKIVVLDALANMYGNSDMTKESVVVTKTATLVNGSILKADGTQAAKADQATATGIVDAPALDLAAIGDLVAVSVVRRWSKVDKSTLVFSDGAYGSEALTALVAAGVILA